MRRKIEAIILTNGEFFKPCPKGKFETKSGLGLENECIVKHLGRQIYLIGYFDFHKKGGSILGEQSRVNKYMIVFPNFIERVIFK